MKIVTVRVTKRICQGCSVPLLLLLYPNVILQNFFNMQEWDKYPPLTPVYTHVEKVVRKRTETSTEKKFLKI